MTPPHPPPRTSTMSSFSSDYIDLTLCINLLYAIHYLSNEGKRAHNCPINPAEPCSIHLVNVIILAYYIYTE